MMSAICAQITSVPALAPQVWLEQYGDYLYKHALFRLRDPVAAEDVVQETLLAALKSGNQFAGRSNVRTWLVGILKHKIIDHFRKQPCEVTSDYIVNDEEFFDHEGYWKATNRPAEWNVNPESETEIKDFQRVLEFCLNQLPERLARVFILREIDELTSEEICRLMDITPTNLWVMLHRARLRLQQLLGLYWFKDAPTMDNSRKCVSRVA